MAYLTTTELQNEGAWMETNWQPVIPDAASLTTWLGTIVTRVAKHTEWRVTTADYGTSDTLLQAILKELELNLAQYYVLMSLAAIADSSDNPEQNPAVGNGGALRATAMQYKARYDEMIRWWGESAAMRSGMQFRRARALGDDVGPLEAIFPPFEAEVSAEQAT